MKKGSVLFGGIFFIAGIAAFYFMVLSPVIDATRMQFWHSTKAQLTQAEVTSYQSRNDDGSNTTMYRLKIQYQYQVANSQYSGDRAAIINDTSSSDSSDVYMLLGKINYEQSQQQGIHIWYDPQNPHQSVYDRSLDSRLSIVMTMFSSVFMVIGVGMIRYSLPDKEQLLENIVVDKPWTTRVEWASPIIYSNAQAKVKYARYFAFLSCLFFGMFSVALIDRNTIATIFAVLLLMIPIWLILRAKRIQKEWLFFKKVPLTLNPYPGMVGGKVKGSLLIPSQEMANNTYSVTLKCIKYWTERSGGKTQFHQSIVFSTKHQPMVRPRADGAFIEFDFDVPAEKPESSAPSNHYHKWLIEIKGEHSGISFNRDYEVPVFITSQSMTIADELEQTPLSPQEKSSINDRLTLNISSHQQLMTLTTPKSSSSLAIAGIGGIFFISGVLIATVGESFFGIIFSLMSTIFIVLGLWGWGRNCKINITPNLCVVDVYWLSTLVKRHQLTNNDINEIQAFSSSSTHRNGKQLPQTFCLRLLTHTGKRIDLGGEFTTKKNAIYLKNEIEQVLMAQ